MCEKCRTKKKKIFWLDQYREMAEAAKKLSSTLQSSHPGIQLLIHEHLISGKKSKIELEEKILEYIIEITTPREHPGTKFVQPELWQE